MLKATRKKPRNTPAPAAAPAPAHQKDGSFKHALLGWYGVVGLALSYVLPFRFPFAETYAKDYWRHALGSLLLVLALIASAIGAALYLFDANDFKAQIIDYVRQEKQRDLTIDGDIHVAFFPRLGLDTGRMSLTERSSSRKFASVENARLYVAWWPLLRRQLQVERVVLDGLHANVERRKDGSTNFDDLVGAARQLGDIRFELDRIRVLASSIHVQDDVSGIALSVHDLDVETGRLADEAAGKLKASFRLESNAPRVDARVQLDGHLQYERATQRYDMADLHAHVEGEAAGVSDLALDLRSSLTANATAGQTTLNNVAATLTGKLEERPLELQLAAASLKIDRQLWHGSNLSLDGRLPGASGWRAQLEVPTLSADARSLQSGDVSLMLGLDRDGRAWQGQFKGPLQLDFANQQLAFPALSGQWSVNHPLLAARVQAPVEGKLLAQWPGRTIRLDFSSQLDESRIQGSVQLEDFKSPVYVLDLNVDALDLDHYLARDWPQRLQAPGQAIDLSALHDLKLRGRLRAGSLALGHLRLQDVAAEVRAADAALDINTLTARLYGGTLQGSASLADAGPPRLSLTSRLSGVQLDALLADVLPGDARIAGKGNLAWAFDAQGLTPEAMRRSLKGTASVSLANGSLAGIQLADALAAGKDLLGLPDAERSDTTRLTDSTAFTELRATFDLGQDAASSSDLLLRSPLLSARGKLEVSLDSGDVDAALLATVANGLSRGKAGDLADLAGIRIPLRINGPWDSAAVTYQLGQASGGNLARLAKLNRARVAEAASPAR